MRCGLTMSVTGQTGQSEAIHSPDACASMVVRLISPASRSSAVVCTVAISCWPSVLRTMSSPLASGAYRKDRSASPGRPLRSVATSDFSGLTSAACALARAVASAATVSLDRGMGGLRLEKVETDGAGLGALRAHAVPDRFLGVLRHERLEFALGALVLQKGSAGVAVECREFRPGIGGAHVDNADGFDAWPWHFRI